MSGLTVEDKADVREILEETVKRAVNTWNKWGLESVPVDRLCNVLEQLRQIDKEEQC